MAVIFTNSTEPDTNSFLDFSEKDRLHQLFLSLHGTEKNLKKLTGILNDLSLIEPFAVLDTIAAAPKSLKTLKLYFQEYPDKKNMILNSYNWDERHHVYGSINAGILAVKTERPDLLKYFIKNNLFLPWQDHQGRNLLFYFGLQHNKNWQRDSILFDKKRKPPQKTVDAQSSMLSLLLQRQEAKALLGKKNWAGKTAYEEFCQEKEIMMSTTRMEYQGDAFAQWDTIWQKYILLTSMPELHDKQNTPKRKI